MLSSLSPWGIPRVDSKGEKIKFSSPARLLENAFLDTLSDCRSIACALLIDIVFFSEYQLRIPPFCHVCIYIFFVCSGHFFVGIVEVYGECWRKVDKKETYNLPLCLLVGNNPKSKKNRWIRWKIFQGVFEKKKHMKRLSFITKIEFLLLFTNCRKVLRKMPALLTEDLSWY